MTNGAPKPKECNPFPTDDILGPEDIKWQDALAWAKVNKIPVSAKPLDVLLAINVARASWGLPHFRIADLADRFRVVRRRRLSSPEQQPVA